MIDYTKIPREYHKLVRSVEMTANGSFHSCFILGKGGVGKSYYVDHALTELKAKHTVLTGDMSDAYLYQYMYENRDNSIVVFREILSD